DGIRDRTVTGVQTCALPIFTDPTVGVPDPWLGTLPAARRRRRGRGGGRLLCRRQRWARGLSVVGPKPCATCLARRRSALASVRRSEERRVGKACGAGCGAGG